MSFLNSLIILTQSKSFRSKWRHIECCVVGKTEAYEERELRLSHRKKVCYSCVITVSADSQERHCRSREYPGSSKPSKETFTKSGINHIVANVSKYVENSISSLILWPLIWHFWKIRGEMKPWCVGNACSPDF